MTSAIAIIIEFKIASGPLDRFTASQHLQVKPLKNVTHINHFRTLNKVLP